MQSGLRRALAESGGGGIIILLALTDLALRQAGYLLPDIINKFLLISIVPFVYIFLFGAYCYLYRDKAIPLFVKWWKPLTVLYILWGLLPEKYTDVLNGVRYNVLTTFMLMSIVIGLGYSFGKVRVKHEISYHFYLYHMVVINIFVHNFFDGRVGILEGFMYFSLTLAFTSIFAVFSERIVDGYIVNKLVSRHAKNS